MSRTRIFKSGNSQAVRIPQEYQLPYGEVEISRQGRSLLLTPIRKQDGGAIFDALAAIEGPIVREQPANQEREPIL